MTIRIAQFVHPRNDVLDAAFLGDFPEITAVKAAAPDEVAGALRGAEVLITTNSAFTPEFARTLRDNADALKWIQFTTVGIDIADAAGLPPGLWLTNSGDVMQTTLATHAVALMLAVQRGLHRYEESRARRAWDRDAFARHLAVPEGGTLVVLGMGRIGQDIARKARAFGMTVICVTRASEPAIPAIDRVVARERVDEVLPEADVVMVAMPLEDDTKGYLSARRIALMKPTAVLVNISRGLVVDEAALAEALAAGRLSGAGLDAFGDEPLPADSPFWGLDNVVITPHIGGQAGDHNRRKFAELVRDNTRRYLDGKPLLNVVRAPGARQQGELP
jgi:phosphoglycerate dehydrogenase-like enzyme